MLGPNRDVHRAPNDTGSLGGHDRRGWRRCLRPGRLNGAELCELGGVTMVGKTGILAVDGLFL